MRERNRLSSGVLAAASASSLLLLPSTVYAYDPWAVSPVLSVQVAFGRRPEVGVALELSASYIYGIGSAGCSRKFGGVGPYGQIAWMSSSGWRVGAGLQTFGEISQDFFLLGTQAGWSYHAGRKDTLPVHGVRFALVPQLTSPALVAAQLPLALEYAPGSAGVEGQIGLGAALPPMQGLTGFCTSIGGRPLRTDGAPCVAEIVSLDEPCATTPSLEGAVLAESWLDDARAECSAITAFLALARDLAAAGAPHALVAASLRAADDEIDHTLRCTAEATRHAGTRFAPIVPSLPPPSDESRAQALSRLARESYLDGCLGEGTAAAVARAARSQAHDEPARIAHSTIAGDEQRHADLGWRILEWTLHAGGAPVREAVRATVAVAPLRLAPRPERAGDPRRLRAHGRLTATDELRIAETVRAQAAARASSLLASR